MDTDTTKKDWAVVLGKGALGAVPFVGPLIAEVISTLIPNQRLDRIAKFVEALDTKVKELDQQRVKTEFTKPGFIDLLEDGFYQAARALTDERIDYIASLVKNGLSDEQFEYIQSKKLLSILGSLNDTEVIILVSRARNLRNDKEFLQKHKAVITPPSASTGSSQEEIDRHTLYTSYQSHLVNLGLLHPRFQRPKKGELPVFDEKTGMMKASGYDLTSLGRLLLRHIDQAGSI